MLKKNEYDETRRRLTPENKQNYKKKYREKMSILVGNSSSICLCNNVIYKWKMMKIK